jgi:hypothetical protein
VAALDLNDVWQLHTPSPKWGIVTLQVPNGITAAEILDGRLERTALPVPTLVLEDVARFGDGVATGWASVMLISPAVQAKLAPFGGWQPIPVSSSEHRLNGYVVLSLSGRIGPVVEEAGGVGLFVDPATWDGKALFKPENRRGIWMTGNAASALGKARLKGVEVDRYLGWEGQMSQPLAE